MVSAKRCITIENEPNMKPVQICTGFILCSFPKILTAKQNFHMHIFITLRCGWEGYNAVQYTEDIYIFEVNTKYISSRVLKTSEFS